MEIKSSFKKHRKWLKTFQILEEAYPNISALKNKRNKKDNQIQLYIDLKFMSDLKNGKLLIGKTFRTNMIKS